MNRQIFAIALCLATIAACTDSDRARNTISRERFVATNVALRMLDSTATAAQRDSVLRRHRVSEQQLRAFVAAHARDTTLAGVWEEIGTRLEANRPSAPTPAAPSPPPRKLPVPRRPGTPGTAAT